MTKFKLKTIKYFQSHILETEIIAFLVVRNESIRLPFLLNYYRRLGVDKFFVIDNDSQDDTRIFLLQQEDVAIFFTEDRYSEHWNWMQYLFLKFGLSNWCLVVDADEILIYPHSDILDLRGLCNFFEQEGSKAFHCLLLDMYPNIPMKEVVYKKGDDPIITAPWFDPGSHFKMWNRYYGGMRKRVFDIELPCVSKFPVLRINKDLLPSQGMHSTPMRPKSSIMGTLLHFKYNSDFILKAQKEADRGEYWNNSAEYKSYAGKIRTNPDLNLYYNDSVKFISNQQLIDLGIMKTSEDFEKFVNR